MYQILFYLFHAKGKNMAAVTKFVYIVIHFLSLFFIAKNDATGKSLFIILQFYSLLIPLISNIYIFSFIITAIFCREDSHCVTKIKCVLPRKPQCRYEACGCYDSNKFR